MRAIILASTLLLATPAFAEDLMLGSQLGTSIETITATLTGMGWEVRKIETEDGLIEVYAVMGKQMLEIYVNPTTGEVVKMSNDD